MNVRVRHDVARPRVLALDQARVDAVHVLIVCIEGLALQFGRVRAQRARGLERCQVRMEIVRVTEARWGTSCFDFEMKINRKPVGMLSRFERVNRACAYEVVV